MKNTIRRYVMDLGGGSIRIFYSDNPPEGVIELEREPQKDEILSVEKGKCKYTKISKGLRQKTVEERLKALEDKLK